MNMQNVKAGDMALIHNNGPRLPWKLGIVTALFKELMVWFVLYMLGLTTEL